MPKDMFLPEAYPIKLKITPDGDKFKCVVSLGDGDKSPPVHGKTAAECIARVAVHLVDKQLECDVINEMADLLGIDLEAEPKDKEKAGSRE